MLQSYLTSWLQGGSQIVTFSAKGIFHIADELGISVTESDVKETSDGSGYYFTAKAENLHTGRTFVAHVYQSATMKRGGKEVPDADAISKGSTRVARNAISGLIPVELLKTRVQDAVRAGEMQKSALIQAQQDARKQLAAARKALADEFSLTPSEAFEKAQELQGDATEWDATAWGAFSDALSNLSPEWFAD